MQEETSWSLFCLCLIIFSLISIMLLRYGLLLSVTFREWKGGLNCCLFFWSLLADMWLRDSLKEMFVLFLVKTVWIVLIVTGVLFPCAVIVIIIYFVHKRRKCTRKDKRSKYIILSLFDNSGVTIKYCIYIYIYFFFVVFLFFCFCILECCIVFFRRRLM